MAATELKMYLKRLDLNLIFDEVFYENAVNFMEVHSLDSRYASWLHEFCKKRKPDNIAGYYFRIFFEPRYIELYRENQKQLVPKIIKCPVCDAVHETGEQACPHCGLEADARYDQEKISREKKLYSMPLEIRKAYETEMDTIFKEGFSQNPGEVTSKMKDLNQKYGL
jgi:hypothetical protein